jgi:GDP-4-dehydro-6-deoxy-D-mannose reductase
MKRLLVTGWDGFVGSTARRLLNSGGEPGRFEVLLNSGGEPGRFEVVIPGGTIDLLDKTTLESAIHETRPDCVLHLAAQSFVPGSLDNPRATYDVNFYGTLNLLEALRAHGFKGRMLYVGSGDVYGWVEPNALPAIETQPLCPRNPYAVSKAAAELLCYQWTQSYYFDIVITRPFNQIGPGQAERFVVPDFARQVAEIKRGIREPVIRVGNINVTRDFTDVRDVVRAYLLLLERGNQGGVYNVCSGRERSIRSILEQLIDIARVDCKIVLDEQRMRPTEQKRMYGSYAKLNRQTGWQPEIEFGQSLRDVLSYWESRLKNG